MTSPHMRSLYEHRVKTHNKETSPLLQSDLSCRNTKQTVGAIYTRTNFVTLKYVTDGWGTESNGFKLVITAFKDKSKYKIEGEKNIVFSHVYPCILILTALF
jgi:hypothetical protein